MKNREQVRSLIIRLTAAQYHTTPDQITDASVIFCPYPLILDALAELKMFVNLTDGQRLSTVDDVVIALCGETIKPADKPTTKGWPEESWD